MNIPTNLRKTSKNINTTLKKTLDIQHSSKLTQIQEFEAKHSELKKELKNINTQIDELTKLKKTVGLSDSDFDNYISLIDAKDDTQKEIERLQEQINEVDYYVNTAPILFKYYDILEKGASDDENVNKIDVSENSILKFFIKPPNEDDKKDNKDDRASLLEKYLSLTDDNYITKIPTDITDCCKFCGSSNLYLLPNDGINYCNDCCSIEPITIDHDKPSYKEPPLEVSYFCYKRRFYALESLTFIIIIQY